MTTPPAPHATNAAHVPQPTMADVFAGMPGDSAQLVAAVHQQVSALAPLAPVVVPGFEDEPRARPFPYVDSLGWSLLKNAVQLALVCSAVMLVTHGGNDPVMALSYVATALLLTGIVAVADRDRFADRDPGMAIVEFLVPVPRTSAPPPPSPVAPLVPLAEQMQVAMPARVDVT